MTRERMSAAEYVNAAGGFAGLEKGTPRRGGRRSRDKGNRMEREVVNRFLAAGISAERVPLSGAAGGSYKGDLTVVVQNEDWQGECKARATGFRQTYDWIEGNKLLFLKADRMPTLVAMRLEDFIAIIGGKV
mgnify:FL=1